MTWKSLETWGVQHWLTSDANDQLRDNVKNIRNMQVAQKSTTYHAGNNTPGGMVTYGGLSNLCPVAPDEPTILIALLVIMIDFTTGGSNNGIDAQIKDQGNVIISQTRSGGGITSTNAGACITRTGMTTVAANTNPGAYPQILALTGTGTPNVQFSLTFTCWVMATVLT